MKMTSKNAWWQKTIVLAVALLVPGVSALAATLAAKVSVTGTDNATTVATVLRQTAGPALEVATSPSNFGDLTLLVGGNPLPQANGVIIPAPNQMRYSAVGDRNMIEVPGELTDTIPGGFPNGMWLSTTKVAGAGAEDNFNLSFVHFPFADGWTAGHVSATDGSLFAGNGAGATITPQFNLPTTNFGNGHYTVSVAGTDSRSSGMLFAAGGRNSGSGNVVPVGILPDGSGWDIRINDQGLNFPATEQANWSFVYVPYDAQNLMAGGQLSLGLDITVLNTVGTFTASRVDLGVNGSITPPTAPDGLNDAGRFLIQIPGQDDTTGILMIGVSKYATAGGLFGADDNFLTYEYNSSLGGFLIETYDLTGATLQDSDVYFAFFRYDSPLAIPEPTTLWLGAMAFFILGFARRRAAR